MIQIDTILLAGFCFGLAVYWLLAGRALRAVFGLTLLSNAANLFLLALSGEPSGKSEPIVSGVGAAPVDPLPQALILTAIVIGFGVTAYLVMLLVRLRREEEGP